MGKKMKKSTLTIGLAVYILVGCQSVNNKGRQVTVKPCNDVRRDLSVPYQGAETQYQCGRFGSGGLAYKVVFLGDDGKQYPAKEADK